MSNIQQNLAKILSSRYGRDVRQSIHDGIHDCYEDGKAGAIDLIARELIQQKMSGSPHGVYPTLTELQAAKPSGDSGIYVVTADGNWYYWSGSAWTAGGVYQSAAIGNDSLGYQKLRHNTYGLHMGNNEVSWDETTKKLTLHQRNGYLVFQSKLTANYALIPTQTDYEYTVKAVTNLILTWDPSTIVSSGSLAMLSELTDTQIRLNGGLLRNQHLIVGSAGIGHFSSIDVINTAMTTDVVQKNINRAGEIYLGAPFDYNPVSGLAVFSLNNGYLHFQSKITGRYILISMQGAYEYTTETNKNLVLTWDTKTSLSGELPGVLTEMTTQEIVASSGLKANQHLIIGKSVMSVYSAIDGITATLDRKIHTESTVSGDSLKPEPTSVKLKDAAPLFFQLWKNPTKDVCIVHIGDSISTTNYYTSPRLDAKNRPPLMVEYAYPTYIEEQLRWAGQKYYRFDVPDVFTETASSADTAEYDEAWDWVITPLAHNNRPAITRILNGTNAKVSYSVPVGVKRCDFIYRTDYLNAVSASVAISSGTGVLQVYDAGSDAWVEAHGYSYSAKESNADIVNSFGTLHRSMYQKRLKMKVVGALSNTTVTITNSGAGRLTYWGIQTGMLEHMMDYILSARGGHSIARLESFEEWDVDYYKPDLILYQLPILNEGLDVAEASFAPRNVGTNTVAAFAGRLLAKAQALKAKAYAPELLTFTMWFGLGNNAMNQDNDWVYGYDNDGRNVSVPEYLRTTEALLTSNNIHHISLFENLYEYAKRVSVRDGVSIVNLTLVGSGATGQSWTFDGGHFNDKGARLVDGIVRPVFLG